MYCASVLHGYTVLLLQMEKQSQKWLAPDRAAPEMPYVRPMSKMGA